MNTRRRLAGILTLGLSLLLLAVSAGAETPEPTRLPGQSATLLPDGRWLLIGGEGPQGLQASVAVYDPRSGATTPTTVVLPSPRSGQSATLLPDGSVVVVGGLGLDGQVVDTVLRLRLDTAILEVLPATSLTARAFHTATLLTDAAVLIAGGVGATGNVLATAELWDPRTGHGAGVPGRLTSARAQHTATLEADGTVLLRGGLDAQGTALVTGERYDPATQRFTAVSGPWPSGVTADPPAVTGAHPADGARDVALDVVLAVRFSRPLRVESVTSQTVVLSSPQGIEPATVVPAEGGRLAFVTPDGPLRPATPYTLALNGPTDPAGLALPFTVVRFTTADPPGAGPMLPGGAPGGPRSAPGSPAEAGADPADDESWVPTGGTGPEAWRTGRPDSPWRQLPPLLAPVGTTALAGQVLRLNGQPLADVTLRLGEQSTRTDATGRFLLTGIPAGRHVLLIDGRSASRPERMYGVFEVGVRIAEGQTTVLPFTVWMPKLDTAHAVTLPAPGPTEVVVTTPLIPGLELRLPPGTTITDHEHQRVRTISITPVPLDRPPFPVPEGLEIPVYFTIQPGGGSVYSWGRRGARLIYPNAKRWVPGAPVQFWHYDPEDARGWFVYGFGAVMPDGRQVVPDPGVELYAFTGAMASPPIPRPPCAPRCPPPPSPDPDPDPGDGDPVDLSTGYFVSTKTDLVLPDVLPITLTRTYRTGDSNVREFGRGMTHAYSLFLSSLNPYQEVDLFLPDTAQVHYVRISPGTGFADAVFEHTETPSIWSRSRIVWNGSGWDLTRRDGMVFVFGDNAPLQAIRDRFGSQLTLTRANGPRGALTRITSSNGRWVTFTADLTGSRILEARDNLGRVITYTYDAANRLVRVTDAAGGSTEYTYDSADRMLTIKDPRGLVFLTNQYDANGRVSRQTQADTTTYQFAYTLDATGAVTQTDVTNPRGHVRRVTFNAAGYILTDTRALGTPEQQTMSYQREAGTHRTLARTDALGRRTDYTYDDLGNRTSVTRLAGTAEAVTTTYTYEPTFSQVATVTDPLNHTTTFSYDSRGALTAIIDPLTHTTTVTTNAAGQPTAITVAADTSVAATTQFGYDAGDLVTITDPLGRVTRRFVDGAGRVLSVTDPLGRPTRYEYDALNRLTKVTDALGGLTRFTYDGNGNLLTVTDPKNSVTQYTYDSMDRVATRKDPLLRTETYQYDGMGNLAQVTDRKAQVTTFQYDPLNRRTLTTYQGGSSTSSGYDAGNRLQTVTDSLAGTITRTYDNLDRVTQETTPQGTVSYGYDAAGRRTTLTVAGQPPVSYAYDNADRLTQLTQGASTVSLSYDPANRRTSLTLPNGVTVEYAYDAASQLTGVTYTLGPTPLGTLTYTYDLAGQRTQLGGSWARTGLPAALNSATYDATHQLKKWGNKNVSSDANGNLLGDTSKNYTWNSRNQLASISGGGTTASFAYDGLGRRIRKTVNGTTTEFLYDGLNPVQELSGTTVIANLLTGLGLDEYFTRTDVSGTRNFLTDALGSTLALTDAAGAVQTQYAYDPFGKTTPSGPTSTNTFQYTGRENDATGLYYYRARYYHPGLQRFISEDPIATAVFGMCPAPRAALYAANSADLGNLYAYVGNRPVAVTDPSGLGPCEDDLASCLGRSAALQRQCLENVLRLTVACATGCLVGCAAAGPAFPACFGSCASACGGSASSATAFCTGVFAVERAKCLWTYANCQNPGGSGGPSPGGPSSPGPGNPSSPGRKG